MQRCSRTNRPVPAPEPHRHPLIAGVAQPQPQTLGQPLIRRRSQVQSLPPVLCHRPSPASGNSHFPLQITSTAGPVTPRLSIESLSHRGSSVGRAPSLVGITHQRLASNSISRLKAVSTCHRRLIGRLQVRPLRGPLPAPRNAAPFTFIWLGGRVDPRGLPRFWAGPQTRSPSSNGRAPDILNVTGVGKPGTARSIGRNHCD